MGDFQVVLYGTVIHGERMVHKATPIENMAHSNPVRIEVQP